MRSRQPIAVVLTAVRDGECLTLELLLAHLVNLISDELGATRRLLEGHLFLAETHHGGSGRI